MIRISRGRNPPQVLHWLTPAAFYIRSSPHSRPDQPDLAGRWFEQTPRPLDATANAEFRPPLQ